MDTKLESFSIPVLLSEYSYQSLPGNGVRSKSFILTICILCLFLNSAADASNAKLIKAENLFRMHCKKAGEKIVRTVDNVEGVYILNLRTSRNFDDQFAMDDPYGKDFINDGYFQTFLRESYEIMERHRLRYPALAKKSNPRAQVGYAYVEAINPANGIRYRYTGRIEQPGLNDPSHVKDYFKFVLESAPSSGPPPRYGVMFEDISTHQDRLHWIAGSSLKVIDLKEEKVIAERVGYMMDRGQGNTNGGRSPWLLAASTSCPQFPLPYPTTNQLSQTDRFVEKVLRPITKKNP